MEREDGGSEAKGREGLHFVLIHGFCGGSWCWFKLKCLLESSGHLTTSLDLRASGTDPTNISSVISFDDYNLPLDHFFASLPDGQKVILVGHSAGGLSVTDALRKFPNKIHVAVYVAATMLEFGYRTSDDFKIDFTLAAILSRPGPLRAIVNMSGNNKTYKETRESERVPRVYIKTLQDKAMKPQQQQAMIVKWPPQEVYAIDSDHSPFFSNPFVLFGLLLKAASLPYICTPKLDS